jgi:hypothetical protein
MVAWNERIGQRGSPEYPTTANRWGLAATAGALHRFHVDCNGLGTSVEVKTGTTWWIVARPKDLSCLDDLLDINKLVAFTAEDVSIPEGWMLEAILLEPGTQLYVIDIVRSIVLTYFPLDTCDRVHHTL